MRTGIIPAYAGSTGSSCPFQHSYRDHPRIRGEHRKKSRGAMDQRGSSPHTRGAPGRRPEGGSGERIIPAYAGSTSSGSVTRSRTSDHPRIRGEHHFQKAWNSSKAGSSPHTRGARTCRIPAPRSRRIIPAYAGSTSWSRRRRRSWGDHPRIRGEHLSPFAHFSTVNGSSPHTRGALGGSTFRRCFSRIIPAYAGSTWRGLRRPRPQPDHPRIRGEHVLDPRASWLTPGSSPHTRGARPAACPGPCRRRIIPAYAGSTFMIRGR